MGISDFLRTAGDDAKRAKHGANASAQGAEFIPFSLDVRGALGPSAKQFWVGLWKDHIQKAPTRGESKWSAIAERRFWLQRLGVLIANKNAEIIMTKAGAYWDSHGVDRNAFMLRHMYGS